MEHYLIYLSKSNHLMSVHELHSILEQSRRANNKHGITGMLIYIQGRFAKIKSRNINSEISGRFMQILEGSKIDVDCVFDKICNDPRHYDILVLQRTDALSKYFESWSMGFESFSLNEYHNIPGYFRLDDTFVSSAEFQSSDSPLQFLKSFYQRGMQQTTLFNSK